MTFLSAYRVAALDRGVDPGELRIALGDVNDRGHDRRPPGRAEQVTGVGQDRDEITFERTRIGNLLLGADPGAGIEHERLPGRPLPVDGGLGHPRPAGDFIDAEATDAALAEQLEGGGQHAAAGAPHPCVEFASAAVPGGAAERARPGIPSAMV